MKSDGDATRQGVNERSCGLKKAAIPPSWDGAEEKEEAREEEDASTARYRRETTRASETVRSWQPTSESKVNRRWQGEKRQLGFPGTPGRDCPINGRLELPAACCQPVARYAALSFLFTQIPISCDHPWLDASRSHTPAEMDAAEPLFPARSLPETILLN